MPTTSWNQTKGKISETTSGTEDGGRGGGGEKKGPIKEQLDYLDYFDDDHDEDEDDEEIAPLDAMEAARKKKMSLYCPTGKGSEVGTGGRRRVSVSAAVINADSVAKQKVLIMSATKRAETSTAAILARSNQPSRAAETPTA